MVVRGDFLCYLLIIYIQHHLCNSDLPCTYIYHILYHLTVRVEHSNNENNSLYLLNFLRHHSDGSVNSVRIAAG